MKQTLYNFEQGMFREGGVSMSARRTKHPNFRGKFEGGWPTESGRPERPARAVVGRSLATSRKGAEARRHGHLHATLTSTGDLP